MRFHSSCLKEKGGILEMVGRFVFGWIFGFWIVLSIQYLLAWSLWIFFFCPAASFFEHQASQDFDLLGQFLPADILQCLSLAILDGAIDDLPIWCLHSNGTSASKSTKVLFPMLPAQEAGQWQNLWRVKVPPRISFLLWQAHHECLKGVSSTQSDYTVDSL